MPKLVIEKVQLPESQPKCCAECPLCGLIPKNERPKGTKETHVCLGTHFALAGRGIVSTHERHKRPCDRMWRLWQTIPGRKFPLRMEYYAKYRVPFDQSKQMHIIFRDFYT